MIVRHAPARTTAAVPTALAEPRASRSRWPVLVLAVVVGLILATHYAVAYTSAARQSLTYDEGAHLLGGTTYWLRNDFRFQPENGNLPQRWCAIPAALASSTRLPAEQDPCWKESNVWTGADRFLFGGDNDGRMLIRQGRAMAAIWGVLLCLAVFVWSRHLFGTFGGLISLVSCAACPTLLAHGPLMTSDACLAFFLLVSVAGIWSLLQKVTWPRLAAVIVSVGLLFLAKASALLIFPIAAVLVVVRLRNPQPLPVLLLGRTWRIELFSCKCLTIATAISLCGATTWLAVWGAYGGRYAALNQATCPPGALFQFNHVAGVTAQLPPTSARVVRQLAAARVLPEAYLYGLSYVAIHRERVTFLSGNYTYGGFIGFFPFCLTTKTPLALWGLLAAAGVALMRGPVASPRRQSCAIATPCWYSLTPLLVLGGVYFIIAVASGLNVGHRHLLPIYPVLHILAGASVAWIAASSRWLRSIPLVLIGAMVLTTVWVYPYYLAYFNPLIGRENGYKNLVDSSLDWGQALPDLTEWLDENNPPGTTNQPVFLAYFGKDHPEQWGIDATRIGQPRPTGVSAYQPGLYCISASLLQGVYTNPVGPWSQKHETHYQAWRKEVSAYRALPAAERAAARQHATPELRTALQMIDQARFVRLMASLRHREPLAQAGYSILIFRLSAADLREAFDGPPAELEPLALLDRVRLERSLHGDTK